MIYFAAKQHRLKSCWWLKATLQQSNIV